jgi:hypothetical protein
MRIRRAVIPAIIALGFAGSALMGSAASAIAATHAPSAHSQRVTAFQVTGVYYRG